MVKASNVLLNLEQKEAYTCQECVDRILSNFRRDGNSQGIF
jgi:hypothetical protein